MSHYSYKSCEGTSKLLTVFSVKSADEFAQKAEDTGKLVWITKSNSLRRTANDKEMTRINIENKIANVVGELKKT